MTIDDDIKNDPLLKRSLCTCKLAGKLVFGGYNSIIAPIIGQSYVILNDENLNFCEVGAIFCSTKNNFLILVSLFRFMPTIIKPQLSLRCFDYLCAKITTVWYQSSAGVPKCSSIEVPSTTNP